MFIPPGRKLGTPFVLGGDSEDSVSTTVTNHSIQEGGQYVDGGTGTIGNEKDSEAKDDRIFWLRPRRRIRQQDLDKLFGPDRQ